LGIRLPALQLPTFLRGVLRKPLSRLVVSAGTIRGLKADYAVGDVVSRRHITQYKIFNGKTMRKEFFSREFRAVLINPASTISLNAFTMLKCMARREYFVEGEEDLLTLAICRETVNKHILYGQPGAGVVVLVANPYWAINVIKTFKPIIVDYDD